ncbi:Aste57867_19041 [Aphanomyces stellatus]|uniref:Aste57867_19041 protein n=1 Tax=Aphanomyces stellatus TaxID=120398 RepID=A0A485LD37_9STRA|nr:hypothetical protein As57867_018977 [Aphanomyces stellatus]VFT95766.1 Aste57867_19041 [Aphanomyces stellatus]
MKTTAAFVAFTSAVLTVSAGNLHDPPPRDVKFVDTFAAINKYEGQHPDVASLHDQVRRALMEEKRPEPLVAKNTMEEKYKEMKKLRMEIDMATAHCNDDECYVAARDRLLAHLRAQGKHVPDFPPHAPEQRRTDLREFPPPEEFDLERPPPRAQPKFRSQPHHHEEEDEYDDYDDEEAGDGDYVDEFAYDKRPRHSSRRRAYPSDEDFEERIRQQIKMHMLEAQEEMQTRAQWPRDPPSAPGSMCIPFTSICDLNIVLGLVWTLLVVVVVKVVSREPKGRTKKAPTKKTQ